ncbi:response regulator [Cohnella sp. REN36]|uniref:response regulator transcription factor n=1 Tax=Cohnella sp. REN36 TaxID=2887347 RepID=UPI001D14DAF6|nr:response regulator [Cohnella sp. REN36]MCC3375216.1 response regulator [Cohnella sp. REN36]
MHKVLLVDDESWVVESLKDLVEWERHGYEVVGQARNGAEALEAIRRLSPDVVFTDIRMPEMNGLELIQRGKTASLPVQFVIVSGYAEFAYAQKALNQGAFAYCLKPFDEIEITGVLARLSRTLKDQNPPGDRALFSLIGEVEGDQGLRLREELRKRGIAERENDGFFVAVSIGAGTLPTPGVPCLSFKTGAGKTAYLIGGGRAADALAAWRDGLPPGIKGVGVSRGDSDFALIQDRIEEADALAYQYFIAGGPGVFEARPPGEAELNPMLAEMGEAVRERDEAEALRCLDRIEALFRASTLSVRHAFQVYNMAVALLFKLGQSETILYGYDQLAQAFPDVYAMLDELRALAVRSLGQAEEPGGESRNQTFNAMLQHVNRRYREDLSLQGLSEQFFMNPSYISQLFKKEVGETFTAYVTKLRIAQACELLEKSDGSLQDIAEKVGYHDYFYFTRQFKKLTGLTPTHYRQTHS